MSGDFVHLHTHSEYSLLDGLGRVKDLVAEAKRLGHPALAITDHGAMHGAVEFFRAAKKAEIKPIIGLEAYQTVWGRPMGGRDGQFDKENYHLLMLARNMTGYRNLLKISSNSHTNGFYYKPRIDHDFLEKHAEGLIATTGCLGAEVPQLLEQGKEKEAYERLGWYVDLFGKENFYIEIQEHSIPELVRVNKILVPWADKFGLQLLVTNDIHYVKEEDGGPHDVLLCVQTSAHFKDEKRMRLSDASYFMKSRKQLEATFRPLIDLPASAYDNSVRIAEMCEVDLEDKEYHLPDMPIPEGFTYSSYLRHLTVTGLAERYGERSLNEDVQARMEKELRIIDEMGFAIYFLIVADLCDFARSRNIWWNVRGSGAGSIVAYCIGITGLDPLKNNLIFERFLNPGRVTMPDFDLDYPDDQREELIRYTVEKYGSDQVAQIVTFGRMKARAAIRDVGRVKDIPLHQVDRIAKLIPGIPGKPVTIQDVLTEGNEFYNAELVDLYKKEKWVQELLDTSMQLEGVARHSGIHAAAVIVADRELSHYTPLMRGSKSSITATVTQYEFPILESIGLLKVDFLGLSTLSVMREAGRLIRERHGIEYKLDNMPFEGEPARRAFDLLSSGEVSGVFQVESQGMRRVLTEMRPTMFEHIIATISLYRPGPIEYIPNFIRRMHGEEEVEFRHPELEPILGETYGICVSGDALITDARSGRRYRLDEIGDLDDFRVQGVDDQLRPAVGRVTHWIDSGHKPVFEVTLRSGATVKVTADHRLLTEAGWLPLKDLAVGDVIATLPDAPLFWDEIVTIEPAGMEHVYDLTVEGLHNFVANNIIVHNCVYQEQIIQILSGLAGYTPGEADLVRRAISKKKASEIDRHKNIFVEGCAARGIPKDAATDIYADIEFFARYGFNKCLPGDTEIVDPASGRMVRIEDLYTGAAQLDSVVTCEIDDLTLRAGPVAQVMDNGIKPVFRLTTASGRQIEATANHPFYTFDGWRLLEEIAPDDLIAVPRMLPVEGNTEWPDHEVIALGHLLAEGNLCHPHSVYFYSQDPAQVDDYVAAANAFDNVACSQNMHKETWSVYAKRADRSRPPGIVTWAKDLDIWGKTAHTKEIPATAFELTNRQIGLLLSRMWEGDGHLNEMGRSLFYATASQRMARQMQHLFLRLGILSRLRTVEFPYKDGRTGYQLFVTGNANFAAFAEKVAVHFVSPERRAMLGRLVLDTDPIAGTKDIVPLGVKETVRAAKAQAGVTWTQLNAETGVAQREFYPVGNGAKSGYHRNTIERLADYFADTDHGPDLRRYADNDIYWDRVVEITPVGEKQTYDLEVPGTHNFIANDILVHNSHAADYAVITVQTAFLKATYPVEYMAALLLIERDKTEKVVNFISECRRMGIQVLPPDVNYSGLDFEIQEVPADSPVGAAKKDPSIAFNFPVAEGSAIRYGMAAVKNVGAGPVQVIIDARNEGGPFRSLEEFCDRTDLRAVGKRALECLFKVGAFDRFGKRSQLLDVMEEMIARSAGIHIARDSGQLSMFDLMGGADTVVSAPIKLPDIEEAKPRERLAWERELVGVFVTSHPLEEVAANWQKVVTCSCAELDEMYNDRTVVMAGMINSLRTITTKKGDAMAFVQLEDLQGQCEVVVFPRTYAEYRDLLVPDNIILVKGKAQSREGRTTVLADSIQNFITHSSAAGDDEPPARQRPLLDVPTFNGVADLVGLGDGLDYDGLIDLVGDEGEIEDGDGGVTMIEKRDGDRVNVNGGGDNPSAPQTTPPDLLYRGTSMEPVWDDNDDFGNVPAWELFEQASSVKPGSKPASPASQPMPPQSHRPPVKPALQPSATPKAPAAPLSEPKAAAPKVSPKGTGERPEDRKTDDKKQDDSKNGGRTLNITFHRSGNLDRDKFRLKEIYERVRDPRGKDHFSILVDTQGQRHLLQFPNDPCTISDRLTTELEKHFKLEVNVE